MALDQLEVQHGPLPCRGNRTLARSELSQLYVRIDDRRRFALHDRATPRHCLCAVLADGRELPLVQLDDNSQAKYLETILEARLGIVDQPVAGAC